MTTTSYKTLLNKLIALIAERSLQRGDFTLASGKKSTVYVDARKTTMSADGLELIGSLGLNLIRTVGWSPTSVGGLTLGADPVAYAIALASRSAPPAINAFTVRKGPKGHGTSQLIEGCFEPGSRVVVVEDVLTTGASALKAAESVTAAGGVVQGILAVVDREEGGAAAVSMAGYTVRSLVSMRDLGVRAG